MYMYTVSNICKVSSAVAVCKMQFVDIIKDALRFSMKICSL